jgi:hypothetical protein
MRRGDPDDPERALAPRMAEELPLFAPWPEAPAAGTEQRALPIEGSAAERYALWRRTDQGREVLALMSGIALEWLAAGATWIPSRGLWEEARKRMKVRGLCDNRLQGMACREVEDTHPALHGKFRHRRMTAA